MRTFETRVCPAVRFPLQDLTEPSIRQIKPQPNTSLGVVADFRE